MLNDRKGQQSYNMRPDLHTPQEDPHRTWHAERPRQCLCISSSSAASSLQMMHEAAPDCLADPVQCRIDCFSELSTNAFGEKLKEQVEERLRFYEEGVAPTKNTTAMQEALASARVSTPLHPPCVSTLSHRSVQHTDAISCGAEESSCISYAEQ